MVAPDKATARARAPTPLAGIPRPLHLLAPRRISLLPGLPLQLCRPALRRIRCHHMGRVAPAGAVASNIMLVCSVSYKLVRILGNSLISCSECVAQFGAPTTVAVATPTTTSGSQGTGATHTVWVAPTQGVLRYVPFATNASVGDTVSFIWGGGPHTVTKSSILDVCNKTSDAPFASGMQNKSFVCKRIMR
jgi:plastocyanin